MEKRNIIFNISEAVIEMLENRIPKEEHDDFVEKAIRSRFVMIEQEKAMRDLVSHNNAIIDELDAIDAALDVDIEEPLMNGDEFISDDEISDLDGFH